jgi:hypothetical protein
MKKISLAALTLIFSLACNSASALNLDKLADAVNDSGNGSKKASVLDKAFDDVTEKLEKKVEKVTEKLEKRLDKYEEKIEKAEEATDKVVKLVDSLDASKLKEYAALAKTVAIIVAAVFGLFILLLIAVFVQLLKVNKTLKKSQK